MFVQVTEADFVYQYLFNNRLGFTLFLELDIMLQMLIDFILLYSFTVY